MAVVVLVLLVWRDERRDLYLLLAAFLMGLSLTHHVTSGLLLPAGLLFVLLVDRSKLLRLRLVFGGAGLFLLGLLPYVYLPVRASMEVTSRAVSVDPTLVVQDPSTFRGFLDLLTGGDFRGANTPLHLGDGRIYYVDGDVWIHNRVTYGFLVDGKVTIVATGDIHICDNVIYADQGYEGDLLGMVALGKYDSNGNLVSGGNVYFGDPRLGTMYEFNGLMFAANDFLYNTSHIDRTEAEPETGFKVYGNFAAGNHVSVNRDWYDPDGIGRPRPARYDEATGQWFDIMDGSALSPGEINSLRHYQMIVNYDERVRNADTQPPGLPRGPGVIFSGITYWEELSPQG